MPNEDVIIVGAGLAGLSCALELQRQGVGVRILEASDDVGGRVRTDEVEGFLLDRGFQVYLDAYPEGQRLLDYGELRLGAFHPGAMVRFSGKWYQVSDPYRNLFEALRHSINPIGSLGDKMRVLTLRKRVLRRSWQDLFTSKEMTARALLDGLGFSARMINRFFRPLFGGVMLDPSLSVSSRFFEFTFRMMAQGNVSLPSDGMGAIPRQLANRLKPGTVRLNTRVRGIVPQGAGVRVELESGETYSAENVVIATEGPAAMKLLPGFPVVRSRHVTTLYFAADHAPKSGPWIMLNGNNEWPINTVAVTSEAQPALAPDRQALIAVTVLGRMMDSDSNLEAQVRDQLKRWFGRTAERWRLLRIYRIQHAHPDTSPRPLEETSTIHQPGIFVCGDHTSVPTIHHALRSGRRAAQAVIQNADVAVEA